MKNSRTTSLAFLLALAVLVGLPSSAHQQKAALTDIFYNERAGNLEIAHRIALHDAEHALHEATGSSADLVESPEAQAAFATYIASRFSLHREDGKPLPLVLVGQEREDGHLWIYQETKLPDPIEMPFSIANTILQDAVEGQINTVNVRLREEVETFVFGAGDGAKWFGGF